MPKKKKTRKQKILTEQRQNLKYHDLSSSSEMVSHEKKSVKTPAQEDTSGSFSVSLPQSYAAVNHKESFVKTAGAATINTSEYGYLKKDLVKTAILTVLILVAEMLIHFFMK